MKKKSIWAAVLLLFIVSCDNDSGEDPAPTPPEQPDLSEFTVWTGPIVTFQKSPGTDPDVEENQDRITNNVWITRANSGGQIYNAATESEANMNTSPAGTLWARGTTANIENLTFNTFRGTLDRPKDNIGVDLVVLLVEDRLALDIKITGWTQQQTGGFIYERSSEE